MTVDQSDEVVSGPLHALMRRAVDVKASEVQATLMSFAFFFCVLSGYFVLRPIRDAFAAASGVSKLPWMFAGTLGATLLCNPFFSALVVKFPVRKFIPITYHFFVANLVVFYFLMRAGTPSDTTMFDLWVGRAFFVWTSVFNFFITSVFWCFMADVFRSEQAKRLFGFIGVGGTLGSIAGSGATAVLAERIGSVNLLIVSMVLLELAVLAVIKFPLRGAGHAAAIDSAAADKQVIGGSIWAGFTSVAKSPYLLGICAFLILYAIGSTFLYFEQTDIVGRFYADRAARTAVSAKIDFYAETITVLIQIFFTGRIIRWLGLAVTLALLPIITMGGFATVGAVPVFATLATFVVIRRASNFALTNPAMEVLFTVVPREDKYKAKNIIETFVYRGGDQIGAWTFAGLSALGLGLSGISFVGVPIAAVWLSLGLWLGRKQAVLAAGEHTLDPVPAPAPATAVPAAT